LRAIAILTVVGSHLAIPGFSGGYVGVDIFFVISGYLIINQILEDIRTEQFNLFDFFARRVFRILPAFLVVMVCCVALATTVFIQPDVRQFAGSVFYTGIMLANRFFLRQQNYFDMAAFTKPLLHMWSLAVEEQFYIVTPLLLIGLTAATRAAKNGTAGRIWSTAVVALAVLSFAGCVVFTDLPGRPNYSFYLTPFRGWEFILGGVIPVVVAWFRHRPSWPIARWTIDGLAVSGAVLIVASVVMFNDATPYPSYRAAPPAVGAMALIVTGLLKSENVVARLLSTKPMIAIGLVSYSWYLWHWPLISFVRTSNFGQANVAKELSVGVLSLLLAAVTYRYIEAPMRGLRRRLKIQPGWLAAAGAASCVVVAVAGYLWSLQAAPLIYPALTGLEEFKVVARGQPTIRHHGLLLGDSHANHLAEPLEEFALQRGANFDVIAKNACLPLLLTGQRDGGGVCDPIYDRIKFNDAEFLVIVARWNFYLGLPASDPIDHSDLLRPRPLSGGPQDPYQVLERGLEATITEAIHSGVSRILLIAPLPEFPWYRRIA
jgi:peptidoglycan/LPS O-acetylase OafA/YrhL